MKHPVETLQAFEAARENLKDALRLNKMNQGDLATLMERHPSTLSERLSTNPIGAFMDIASVFPAGLWIAAQLFRDLASAYQHAYDNFTDDKFADIQKQLGRAGGAPAEGNNEG